MTSIELIGSAKEPGADPKHEVSEFAPSDGGLAPHRAAEDATTAGGAAGAHPQSRSTQRSRSIQGVKGALRWLRRREGELGDDCSS